MDTLLMAPLASVLAGFACACLSWLRKDDSVVIKEQYFFFFLTKQMLGYCFVIDILFKTLKKEGHALRNIGNKKYILPVVIKEQYFFFFLTKQMLGYCFVIDILFKTLKKEGHALRNIGNKKYILPTVKSALLLLFKLRYMQKNHGLKQ